MLKSSWSTLSRESFYGLTFCVLLFATYFVYEPGLTGGFLFDDIPNLQGLADISTNLSIDSAFRFILHGISSTLGRPLTLATFAPQYYLWPWHAEGFKYVNLLIHLVNGCLLFWLLIRLCLLIGLPFSRCLTLALATSIVWLIHPLQVSTVLYVIQRMAELSGFFILFGMLSYVHGRHLAVNGSTGWGYAWMTSGLMFGLGLGVLAKENAILLPLFILTLEVTFLQRIGRPRKWWIWAANFLLLPLALLIAYLIINIPAFESTYSFRDFTLVERLLSECRIVFMYLGKLLVPRLGEYGLLYDNYVVSTGLFNPTTTVFAVVGVFILLTGALLLRKQVPVFSFATFWFFGAHLLESSFIPLELVFEHRNYVAIVGPLFAVSYYALRTLDLASARHVRATLAATYTSLIVFCTLITWQVTTVWGHSLELAATWAEEKPDSKRAQYGYANALLFYSYPLEAVKVHEHASHRWRDDPVPLLSVTEIACYYPRVLPPSSKKVLMRLKRGRDDLISVINVLNRIITAMEEGQCSRYSPDVIRSFIAEALNNNFYAPQRQNLLLMYARTSELMGNRDLAVQYWERATMLRPKVELFIQLVKWETERGNLVAARRYLELAKSPSYVSATDRWSYRQDIQTLDRLLHQLEDNLDGAVS